MSALPTTSGGSIANFLDGETVTYQLDKRRAAPCSPAPSRRRRCRSAAPPTVSVTIPAGTLLGAHTVFAVGSLGSTASAAITVVDTTPPVVSAAVINKTSGDRPGFVKQGGTYFVYANANDTAGTTGTHVVSTVTANVTNITTGSTAVALTTTGGPWTVGGVSYAYRSASLTATNPISRRLEDVHRHRDRRFGQHVDRPHRLGHGGQHGADRHGHPDGEQRRHGR